MNSMEKNNFGGFTAGGEMVFEKRGDKISVPVCEKTVVTELSDDLILPDYRPEIRRLLRISASLPTPSPYVSSDMAEFSGDVIYSILYVGGDGKLASAELTAVYDAAKGSMSSCKRLVTSTIQVSISYHTLNLLGVLY